MLHNTCIVRHCGLLNIKNAEVLFNYNHKVAPEMASPFKNFAFSE